MAKSLAGGRDFTKEGLRQEEETRGKDKATQTTVQLRSGSGSNTIIAHPQAHKKTNAYQQLSFKRNSKPPHSLNIPTSHLVSILEFHGRRRHLRHHTTLHCGKKRLPLIKNQRNPPSCANPRAPPQTPLQILKALQTLIHHLQLVHKLSNVTISQLPSVSHGSLSAAETGLSASNLVHLLSCPLYRWTWRLLLWLFAQSAFTHSMRPSFSAPSASSKADANW